MSDIAIRVENLSKKYTIGVAKYRHDTLRDKLAESFKFLFHRNGRPSSVSGRPSELSDPRPSVSGRPPSVRDHSDTIWALKDVSFEMKKGEVLGIIGRNGAGKSTLLKILSRITEPTSGRAEIYGRIGSLLEVGTGFHPELTGRENIYLSGTILGMKKAEIERKFDEIVAFAEVEKFIDTPVKRYSSGMYVRLAFAVAAHLDSEILIVDEVLAVGDAAFQEKCLGTMERSASTGKTVFFVSHYMPSIEKLCHRCILLESGQISADGPPEHVIRTYLTECLSVQAQEKKSVSLRDWQDRVTNGQARIVHFEMANGSGRATNRVPFGGSVCFAITAEFYKPLVDPCFGVLVHDTTGKPIFDLRSTHAGLRIGPAKGNVIIHASVENVGLYPGRYVISPWISDSAVSECFDWVKFCCELRVDPAPGPHGDLKLDPEWGSYWVPSRWRIG